MDELKTAVEGPSYDTDPTPMEEEWETPKRRLHSRENWRATSAEYMTNAERTWLSDERDAPLPRLLDGLKSKHDKSGPLGYCSRIKNAGMEDGAAIPQKRWNCKAYWQCRRCGCRRNRRTTCHLNQRHILRQWLPLSGSMGKQHWKLKWRGRSNTRSGTKSSVTLTARS